MSDLTMYVFCHFSQTLDRSKRVRALLHHVRHGLKGNGNGARLDKGMSRIPRFSPWWLPYEIFNAPTGHVVIAFVGTQPSTPPSRRDEPASLSVDRMRYFSSFPQLSRSHLSTHSCLVRDLGADSTDTWTLAFAAYMFATFIPFLHLNSRYVVKKSATLVPLVNFDTETSCLCMCS